MRTGLVERIEREIEHHAGRPAGARSASRCNSIVDEAIIDALYRASQAGVPVDIWVRGICALRPGRARAVARTSGCARILGRFLEHSRIFAFGNGGEPRGLDRLAPTSCTATSTAGSRRWCGSTLPTTSPSSTSCCELGFDPGTASWHLQPDGEWQRVAYGPDGEPLLDLQAYLIARHQRRKASA